MAKYTIELYDLMKSGFDFGLMDYPIYDETHRSGLNAKILEHYKYYEIGMETPGRFRDVLNRTMNEIMPPFNELYLSYRQKYDPLITFSETEGMEKTTGGTTTYEHGTTVTTDGTNDNTQTRDLLRTDDTKRLSSDTPQTQLTLGFLEDSLYATEAGLGSAESSDAGTIADNSVRHDERVTTGSDTNTNNGTENHTRTRSGFNAVQSELMEKYRATIRNLDMEIVEHPEIAACFMMVM